MLNETQKNEVVALCQKLIQSPSTSGHEEGVVERLKAFFEANGFDSVHVDRYGNVIGCIKGSRPGPRILFDGHIDTVPVGDPATWEHDPFAAEIVDGKIYGRGTSDMKGAVAAMACAAANYAKATNKDFAGEIYVAGVVHEECFEGVAAREISAYVKPDYVVIGEASQLNLKIGQRGRAEIVEKKNGRYEILISEIPYMVNKTRLIESIADLVKDKRIEGISDLNDESSSRTGMKIVIEIKKDANPQVVLNQLYRYTQLQDTVGVIMLALDDGVPKIMSLNTMMERYIEFQMQVIRRRTAFDLKKAKEREHILEGLHKAVDIVDEIIATIRACKGGFAEARQAVMDNFGFDELQADAIVKLQLGRLAGLEILKIEQELGELRTAIADYEDILANDEHVKNIVKTDLTTLADKYGDERRTSIEAVSGEVDIEDLIPEETCVFTLTHEGYIKRTAVDTYSAQNRGGRGVAGMTQKDNDFTEELFVGSTHDYMLFMTDKGRVYRLKGYQVAEGSRTAKGSHIANLLQLQEGEKVTIMMRQPANMDEDASYITMVTRQGLIKRTPLSQFRNIRKGGLNAIALNEDDALVWCHLTGGEDELIVATHDGAAIHFSEAGARAMGRTGHGVRVIKLRDGDYVVGVGVCRPGATVLTVTEDGKGRRSLIDDYRITKRGGLGIRNYTRGGVAGIKIVDDTDDLILISQDGILIRMHANDINVQSRYGSGVRVMRLIGEDKVAVLARVDRDATAETAKPEDDGETDPTPEELEAIAAAEAAEEAAEDAAPDTEGEDEE